MVVYKIDNEDGSFLSRTFMTKLEKRNIRIETSFYLLTN